MLLDDFGTGYSSMQSLQELEFDVLKLDCEFTWGIGRERTEKILDATIALAKALDMATIAEGVETETEECRSPEHKIPRQLLRCLPAVSVYLPALLPHLESYSSSSFQQ